MSYATFRFLLAAMLWVVPLWMILRKLGFSPWIALAKFIPAVGILIPLAVIAFRPWPATQAKGTRT